MTNTPDSPVALPTGAVLIAAQLFIVVAVRDGGQCDDPYGDWTAFALPSVSARPRPTVPVRRLNGDKLPLHANAQRVPAARLGGAAVPVP